jgi:hypothetical protein
VGLILNSRYQIQLTQYHIKAAKWFYSWRKSSQYTSVYHRRDKATWRSDYRLDRHEQGDAALQAFRRSGHSDAISSGFTLVSLCFILFCFVFIPCRFISFPHHGCGGYRDGVSFCLILFLLVSLGFVLFNLVAFGFTLSEFVSFGSTWFHFGFILLHFASFCFILFHFIFSPQPQWVPRWPFIWFHLISLCFFLYNLVPFCSSCFHLVLFCFDPFGFVWLHSVLLWFQFGFTLISFGFIVFHLVSFGLIWFRFIFCWFRFASFCFILFHFVCCVSADGGQSRRWTCHWMFTECSLNVHWMFPECSVNVHWMFPECSLVWWCLTHCDLRESRNKRYAHNKDITYCKDIVLHMLIIW